jgi:hypothetical protein
VNSSKSSLNFIMACPPTHLIVLSLAILCVGIVHGKQLVLVAETNVTYRGIVSDIVEDFQNIKYGQDTSRSHRFAAPEAFTPLVNTIVDARMPGHACP